MPLSSMTGFGQAEAATSSGLYKVEIRSVNNRYLEIQTRIPRSFANLEQKIKKVISGTIARGSVAVSIYWDHEEQDGTLGWDRSAVEKYMAVFREIRDQYGIQQEATLSDLLTFSDIIKKESVAFNENTLWRDVNPVLEQALGRFCASRKKEAAYIIADVQKMVRELLRDLGKIEQRAPVRLKKYKKDITEKIHALAGKNLDQSRLAMEIAMMADKQDIAEECTRLRAHIEKIKQDLKSAEPAGKAMGFILQEMNREANTISSKAYDTTISHLAVALKENIEKIREQSLNIE